MRHQLAHSTCTSLIMYWTLQSNNPRYISQKGQIVQQPSKVDISNHPDPSDGSIDESMILWFREGLLHNIVFRSLVYGVRAASAYGDFAESCHLLERKHNIIVNASTSSPSYLVLPLNDSLSAWIEDIRVPTAGTTDRERHFPRKCRR